MLSWYFIIINFVVKGDAAIEIIRLEEWVVG